MSEAGKVAEAEVCDECSCAVSHLLVRGDVISFVSVEQTKLKGPLSDEEKRNERKLPSDIKIPRNYVLVHDTTGTILDRCDMYVVRWRKTSVRNASNMRTDMNEEALRNAQQYFGADDLRFGSVDIPKGPWHRVARIKHIRYRRVGVHSASYDHEYEVPVDLLYCKKPLAWRLPLPNGCIVDERGFVWP